jgi:phosphoglycerate dehydrogenase-like enzyme
MTRKLVIFPPLEAERLSRLHAIGPDVQIVNAATPDEARREIANAQGFIGKITPDLLAAAPSLEWIQALTASLEHYVFPELIAHPCRLSNMRGLFSDVLADHVLGLMLCFSRNLHTYIRQQEQERWLAVGGETERTGFVSGPGLPTSIDRVHRALNECSLGIVGVGAIGAEIARRALAFGMTVRGVDPIVRSISGTNIRVEDVDRLPELLAASDFVVVAAPHTPETEGWFRRPQFEQMRRSAVFINIGRGAIVALTDLVAALNEKLIAGAALDVFEIEPLPPAHPLWRMDNVILTPHIGAASVLVPQRHLEVLIENVRRFAASEEPLNLVNKTLWF